MSHHPYLLIAICVRETGGKESDRMDPVGVHRGSGHVVEGRPEVYVDRLPPSLPS